MYKPFKIGINANSKLSLYLLKILVFLYKYQPFLKIINKYKFIKKIKQYNTPNNIIL